MKFVLGLLLSLPLFLHAQQQTNIWYFGDSAGIDFSSGTAVPLFNSAMTQLEGSASICDNNGNLLFYTNGVQVWNAGHHVMPNGNGLLGDPSSAQVVIVQKPLSNGIYYIFYADDYGGPYGVRFSEVDMQLDSGRGDVTANKNILLHSNASEKIAAVNNCNGKDVWLMTIDYTTDQFFCYPVTASGIGVPVISGCYPDYGYCCNTMKFSPDGQWLACTNAKPSGGDDSQLYRFNAANGMAFPHCLLPRMAAHNEELYGISFSPDNSKLYIGSFYAQDSIGTYNVLYQYDMTAANIPSTKQEIYRQSFPGNGVDPSPYASLQNAPDGKIYLARWAMWPPMDTLGVIESPNLPGVSCNFNPAGMPLGGRNSLVGLPGFVESYFNQSPPVPCDSISAINYLPAPGISFTIKADPACGMADINTTEQGDLFFYDVTGRLLREVHLQAGEQHLQPGTTGVIYWKFLSAGETTAGQLFMPE